MSEVSSEVLYTSEHEWVLIEDNIATVGISDHAQSELGDITFVELPEDGMEFTAGNESCTIESVKAASPVYAPVSGKIVEVNGDLEAEPGMINSDPYGAGWLYRLEIRDPDEAKKLMSPEKYEAFLNE